MSRVTQGPVPETSLLKSHRGGPHPDAWGQYSDCFTVTVDRAVTLGEFVIAFYTSPVFRLERWILGALLGMPSTDAQARELADGRRDRFAAWTVAERSPTQLLLADFRDQTRSWLAVTPRGTVAHPQTLLQFGSGVASTANPGTGKPQMSWAFRGLSGVHRVYSQMLLQAALRQIGPVSARAGRA